MRPRLVTLINGRARIDDLDEDCPLITFHGSASETQAMAELVMQGLNLVEREREALRGADDDKVRRSATEKRCSAREGLI